MLSQTGYRGAALGLACQFPSFQGRCVLSAAPQGRRLLTLVSPSACLQLDSHPLAGGLISVRLCEDPMRWVVASVGADQVPACCGSFCSLHNLSLCLWPVPLAFSSRPRRICAPDLVHGGRSAPVQLTFAVCCLLCSTPTVQLIGAINGAQQHAAPAATPAQHSQPSTPVPQPLGHPAPGGGSGGDARALPQALSSSGGGGKVSEIESELRQLQEQLQAQALEGAFDEWQAEPGDGWAQHGVDDEGSGDDEQGEGGWHAAGGAGAAAQRARGVRSGGGGGGGSTETRTMLAMHNVDPSRDPRQLFHFFKRQGRRGQRGWRPSQLVGRFGTAACV